MAPLMAVIAAASTVASGAVSIAGGLKAGKDKKRDAFQRAGEERAAGQREFQQRYKDMESIISANQAKAAASGGGATDESMTDLTGDIFSKGYSEALAATDAGENRARGYEEAGRTAMRTAEIGALGTAFETTGKLAKQFGGDFKDYLGKGGGEAGAAEAAGRMYG